MDIQKEKEAFNKEFGIDDADTFPAFSGGIENSAALKCNWLGWKKRAEFEYRENPETIEIDGLKTIHKLCKFADEHNMEGCSFTEIVERMFDELAKAQAVPEGFVLVRKELPESIAETLALDRVAKPVGNEIDPIWIEITENVYKEHLRSKKWELWRDYKAMIEAQEQGHA